MMEHVQIAEMLITARQELLERVDVRAVDLARSMQARSSLRRAAALALLWLAKTIDREAARGAVQLDRRTA